MLAVAAGAGRHSVSSPPPPYPFPSLPFPNTHAFAVWSECTIWVNLQNLASTNLSVFGLMLTRADYDSHHSYFTIQVVAAIPLVRAH